MKTFSMREIRNRRIVSGTFQVKDAKMATSVYLIIRSGTKAYQKTSEGVMSADKEGIIRQNIAKGQEEEKKEPKL